MYSYRIRIRGKTYVWGSRDITKPFEGPSNALISVRVDETGDAVKITRVKQDPQTGANADDLIGRMEPGGAYSLSLVGLCGIFVETIDYPPTFVTCTIHDL